MSGSAISDPRSRLLVLTPSLDILTETFIRRHCFDLLPGETSCVTFHGGQTDPRRGPGPTTTIAASPMPHSSPVGIVRSRLTPPSRRQVFVKPWWVGAESLEQMDGHLRRTRPTVALIEYLDRWLDAIPVLVRAGIRTVAHGHGYDLSAALRRPAVLEAYRQYLPLADAVVAPSYHAATRLQAEVGLQNVHVIPYGLPPMGHPSPRSSTSRPVKAIAVGRLVAKKDPVGLIRAVVEARRRGASVELDVFGDGPLLKRVERELKRARAQAFIRLHGPQPNDVIRKSMREADLFLQRSVTGPNGDQEGLPLAILEAMESGLPVVSTFHAGIPEAVVHRHTGLLAAENDLSSFVENILHYTNNERARREHGERGRSRFNEQFTWQRNRSRLLQILRLDETEG